PLQGQTAALRPFLDPLVPAPNEAINSITCALRGQTTISGTIPIIDIQTTWPDVASAGRRCSGARCAIGSRLLYAEGPRSAALHMRLMRWPLLTCLQRVGRRSSHARIATISRARSAAGTRTVTLVMRLLLMCSLWSTGVQSRSDVKLRKCDASERLGPGQEGT